MGSGGLVSKWVSKCVSRSGGQLYGSKGGSALEVALTSPYPQP